MSYEEKQALKLERYQELKEKAELLRLETEQERYRELNKRAKKEGLQKLPLYILSNLAEAIKNTKDRIAHLENIKKHSWKRNYD